MTAGCCLIMLRSEPSHEEEQITFGSGKYGEESGQHG